MTRLLFFGTGNQQSGELTTNLNRGWMITGALGVMGGGNTELSLSEDKWNHEFIQLGNMILAAHPKLANWAGVIDPEWNAALPVKVTVYNAEYLLKMRVPDQPVTLEGSVGYIVAVMIDLLNAQGDLYIRIGDTSRADQTTRQETLDGRSFWDQLISILEHSNCEMLTRAEKNADGQLIIYVDIATRLGVDTGFLLADGRDGNASFTDLSIQGPIYNRVIGINDGSGPESRLRTAPFIHAESAAKYRIRSHVEQFRGVREQSTLELFTKNYLAYYALPRLSFFLTLKDKGDTFYNARLGNVVRCHISKARMPGGVKGYRGAARILALAYSEADNSLGAKVGLI